MDEDNEKKCCSKLRRCCKKNFLEKVAKFSSSFLAVDVRPKFEGQQQLAENIYFVSVSSVNPATLVKSNVQLIDDTLVIGESKSKKKEKINLREFKKCYVVGFGKAVLPMAEETMRILGSRVERCVISVPVGTRDSLLSTIEAHRGAHNNIPDNDAFLAAKEITEIIKRCRQQDLLIVLISGGGSALLPAPIPPITLEEKSKLIKQLSTAGATINELNTVRKRISLLKGGGIVRMCKAKKIISLILSDVLGDPLDIIASGPTVFNTDDEMDAWKVVNKYLDASFIPESIQTCLTTERGFIKPDIFAVCSNLVIGSNRVAVTAASEAASKISSFIPFIMTLTLDGEAKQVGKDLVSLAIALEDRADVNLENALPIFQKLRLSGVHQSAAGVEKLCEKVVKSRQEGRKLCLLFGGEPIVIVSGSGIGGRNQELVLSASLELHKLQPKRFITILSAGTDGQDGPCNAAGAVANATVVQEAKDQNIDPEEYLANNDSYTFFQNVSGGRYSIVTGPSGTNVMDLIVLLID